MGFFSSAKDRLTEQMALTYINGTLLKGYGRAHDLRIDSTAKNLSVEVDLDGEVAPIKVDIFEYEISHENGRYFVRVKNVQTSRPWLTMLAKDRFCNVRMEIPEHVGRLLIKALQ